MRYYLAGPMSNIPRFNFPAFEQAASNLRTFGYDVISPHECDSEETRKLAWASPDGKTMVGAGAETWGQCLARDVEIVADKVDAIIFLPDWQRSRGAKLEALTGLLTGKKFFNYVEQDTVMFRVNEIPAGTLANELRRAI